MDAQRKISFLAAEAPARTQDSSTGHCSRWPASVIVSEAGLQVLFGVYHFACICEHRQAKVSHGKEVKPPSCH